LSEAGGEAHYRIDRVEDTEARLVEAVRVEPGVYERPSDLEAEVTVSDFAAPLPVYSVFLDLPLMSGDEVDHAPHLAVTAEEWPGVAAVYTSPTGTDYSLLDAISIPATIGEVLEPVGAGPCSVFDRGNRIRVKLTRGALSSITEDALLAGGNVAAIGNGTADGWELVQFLNAELVAEDTYELSVLLRGQAGTEVSMPETWPAGSVFVLIDGTPTQLELAASTRNVAQYFRIGPSGRPFDDPSYTEEIQAFRGIGLRPYAPAHLRATEAGGDLEVTWVRRTRIDGDIWDVPDVPLGEAFEAYRVRVVQGTTVVREAEVTSPVWLYDAAARATDSLSGSYEIRVAQMSEKFGAGGEAVIALA
ncbi:MAG: host specificity protein, partial [Pseudomonadota bacterium]